MRDPVDRRLFPGLLLALVFSVAILTAPTCSPQPLQAVLVATGFLEPVYAASPPGDPRLFVVEKAGTIRIVVGGSVVLPIPFLDLSADLLWSSDTGLLGLAFSPDYATSGRFYVLYVRRNGAIRLVRLRASQIDPNVADLFSWETLLTIPQLFATNKGGHLAFGPDGYLYLSIGDGGGSGDPQDHAQRGDSLQGKILRLDVSPPGAGYAIPPDNPFTLAGDPGDAVRDEIWALGFRNPRRFHLDPNTGILTVGDVGMARQELDALLLEDSAGGNYGWRRMQGGACYTPAVGCNDGTLVLPVHEYTTAVGCDIVDGPTYYGSNWFILGRHFFADQCSGRVFSASFKKRRQTGLVVHELREHTHELAPEVGSIDHPSGFGTDASGELYLFDRDGEMYLLAPVEPSSDAS
jgi:hypothetical protein